MIKHILLDFDHCLAKYRCDGKELDKDMIDAYSILMDNRFKKITFEETIRDGGFYTRNINTILRYVVSYYRPNKKVLDIIKSFQTIYSDIKISIASDSPINTIVQFLDLYDIDIKIEHYFTWETLNWKKKNEQDFYIQIKRSLNIDNYNEIILIEDSIKNISLFEILGGQTLYIESTENYKI